VYRRAEGLLESGHLVDAKALLERHLASHRSDERATILLGRVHLDWPVVGRWRAWRLFRRAAEIVPDDPEPWYWKIKVGRFLGSADGEALMRSGIRGVLERDPLYRDVWDFWGEVYHNPGDLRETAAILERHAGHPVADLRRAHMLVQAEEYAQAEEILEGVLTLRGDDGGAWALRAQAALEAGDTARGLAFYEEALSHVRADSLGFLWRQVAMIAWPDEDSTWAELPAEEREAFLRAFWARREPDLMSGPNERIAEHFTRLRHARDNYRLLHPQSRYHYSVERRVLMGGQAARVLDALQGLVGIGGFIPGRSRFEDEIQRAGVGVDNRDLPEPDSITRYQRYGFDGRGLLYLRFGEPRRRLIDHTSDVEAWDYEVGGTLGRVVFARASADCGGDMVFFPTSVAQLHNTAVMLEQDATSLRANLDVQAWAASFRGDRPGEQVVYVGVAADTAAAALWDADWIEVDRSVGGSLHVLHAGRGRHTVGVDTRRGERRGRLRRQFEVPTYWRGSLTLSSLLVGPAADSVFDRDDVARWMPGDLRYTVGTPLAVYAEVYGLSADRAGFSHFEVEYRFEPTRGGRAVALQFERRAPGRVVIPERVVIQPGRIPPGRYRVYLTVRDVIRRRIAQSTFVEVELR
jgi:tetratricopeptide (TPR) repeat protein